MTLIDALTATATRRQQAEGRLAVIRNALTMADEELARVKAERDWEVFGLGSFTEYCDQMLPDLKFIKLRAPERLNRIKALLAADPNTTEREAAASTGSSAATAHRDFLKATGRSASNEASADLTSLASLSPEDVGHATNWQVIARHVSRTGALGLTCAEFLKDAPRRSPNDSRAPWHQGSASPAFLDAERKGYVRRTGELRGRYAVYVAVTR